MQDVDYQNGIKIVGQEEINKLLEESKISPRKRASVCLHTEKSDMMQRMVMALQPETYMQAHKHESPAKREIFNICQGELAVLIFNEKGDVTDVVNLAANKTQIIEISAGVYHSLIALKPDSIVFEMKDGPWESVEKDKQFAAWAPSEDSEYAKEYLDKLKKQITN